MDDERKLILFTHFYNEEFLLPYFLRHHTKIFDHGVLINYASTDRSVEIIKELAPTWEIRESRNAQFDAHENDLEIRDTEIEFEGWKFPLNITEFVFHPNLKKYLIDWDYQYPDKLAVGMPCAVMVDDPELRYEDIDNSPLYFQKKYGYVDRNQNCRRRRYIHRADHGRFHLGRHMTDLPRVEMYDILVLWFGWSPIEYVRERKLQIQTRMSARDIAGRLGIEHIQTPETLEQEYLRQAGMSGNLLEDELYSSIYNQMKEKF